VGRASRLAAGKGLAVLNPVTAVGLVLIASTWYWPGLIPVSQGMYLLLVLVFAIAALFLQQNLQRGN
jgi:hypothetical protein